MFQDVPKMENEDKINMLAGFLPRPQHILAIINAIGFYARFKDKQEEVVYIPLVAWAFLKNGSMLPLLYKHDNCCHFIAFAVDGFMGVVHDDNVPEDYNDELGEGEFKTK